MSLFFSYIFSLTLKPLVFINSVQVLNFGRHFSHKTPSLGALVLSFNDPFNTSIYRSNQCDVVPSKNSGRKLSHYAAVLSPELIQTLLYSFKNTLGSSPLIPLKTGITMLILILFLEKKHTKLIKKNYQLSLSFYNLSS
jgi:hypothetical protein